MMDYKPKMNRSPNYSKRLMTLTSTAETGQLKSVEYLKLMEEIYMKLWTELKKGWEF